jgi:AraC-like DNA-binding protein
MYINRAYLGGLHEDIVNLTLPLSVTAVGHFRIHTRAVHKTCRENGRGDYQLIYVANGKLHLKKNGKDETVGKGSMILFRPHEPQIYSLYAKDTPETYWVHFTGRDVEDMLASCGICSGTDVVFTGISQNYKFLFRQMIQELQLKRTGFSDMNALQLRQLLVYFGRSINEQIPVSAELLDEIEKALQYFNKYFYTTIVIEEYAKEHHVTPWWFIQSFKKITGTTPAQYILSLRISNAADMLESSDSSIAEIAASVGYENALYFSRLFKKHTGSSPRDYRKQKRMKK